jgi:RNA polymerase sigma-70 factor (ECF subfamily)
MEGTGTTCWRGLEELRPALHRFLCGRCRDENERDDVVQETLLRAARYRSSLVKAERLRGWVLRIAGNVLRDRVRRENRLGRVELADQGLDALTVAESGADDGQERVWRLGRASIGQETAIYHVHRALGRLREGDRRLLGAFYSSGRSCARAATDCGIAPALVKVRLFRARKRLRRAVRRSLAQSSVGMRSA